MHLPRWNTIRLPVVIAIIFAVSAWLQQQFHLNHDVAWVVHSAGWLIDGKIFGKDIVVANPPLIWYLSTPAAWASRLLELNEAIVFRVFVFLTSGLLLWLTWKALHPLRTLGHKVAAEVLLVTIAYCTLIRVGRDFGQREALAVMLTLPYVFVVTCRWFGHPTAKWLAVTSGILAGLGYSLKPYFLLSPVVIEILLALKTRSLRNCFRAESLTLAIVVIVYGASIFLATPDYAYTVVPMVRSIFWAFEAEKSAVLSEFAPYALIFCVSLALMPFSPRAVRPYVILLTGGATGFVAGYLIQAKGYSYHLFPVLTLSTVLLTFVVAAALPFAAQLPVKWRGSVTAYRGALIAVLVLLFAIQIQHILAWYELANLKDGTLGIQTQRLITVANRHASGDKIYSFSTHPYPGFPVVTHSHASWGSRMNSQFVVPAIVKAAKSQQDSPIAGLEKAITFQRRVVLEDFLIHKPKVVFVDNRQIRHAIGESPFDFIEFFTSESEFEIIWKKYKEIEPVDGIRIFIRDGVSRRAVGRERR